VPGNLGSLQRSPDSLAGLRGKGGDGEREGKKKGRGGVIDEKG